MSHTVTRDQLKIMLGDSCQLPTPVSSGTQEVFVSAGVFDKLVIHWGGQSPDERPRLRGVSVARGDAKLLLILSVGDGASVMLAAERGSRVQALREIWPFAAWWEDELSRFEGVTVPERHERGGVTWLPS